MHTSGPDDAWNTLKHEITDARRKRIESAAGQRTNYIRLIIQDVHDPHNVSACMRTAEAMGIQNVDIVTLTESFKTTTVARGVKNWLEIKTYASVQDCAEKVKSDGFMICAGMPATDAVAVDSIPIDAERPLAVLFGNEHAGVSSDWHKFVDLYFTIPMAGLVESMNISVSAAITLHHLTHKARSRFKDQYFIKQEAREKLLNTWAIKTIDNWQKRYERAKQKI